MIASAPRPFIFVHIPKCAGTSIESAFIPVISKHSSFETIPREERNQFWLPGDKGLQHSKLKRYQRHFALQEYFKFAFVRNPWERAISQIGYIRSSTRRAIFGWDNIKKNLRAYCNSRQNVCLHDLAACQIDYLKDESGNVCMDFIGRFESLAQDFRKVCVMMGLDPVPELPHAMNSRRSLHYSAFYDQESASWIRERFAKDIEYFGYKFETVEAGWIETGCEVTEAPALNLPSGRPQGSVDK